MSTTPTFSTPVEHSNFPLPLQTLHHSDPTVGFETAIQQQHDIIIIIIIAVAGLQQSVEFDDNVCAARSVADVDVTHDSVDSCAG